MNPTARHSQVPPYPSLLHARHPLAPNLHPPTPSHLHYFSPHCLTDPLQAGIHSHPPRQRHLTLIMMTFPFSHFPPSRSSLQVLLQCLMLVPMNFAHPKCGDLS